MSKFYVYEHWRPDLDLCFYVGKGHGERAWMFRKRSKDHQKITAELAAQGLCIEVRLVRGGLDEQEALDLEVSQIAIWRRFGVRLVNKTFGGEGVSGLKHSEDTRRVIREKRAHQVIAHSEETKKKIGAANSVALLGRKNPDHSTRMKGRTLTDDHKAAIAKGGLGRIASATTRAKISATQLGKKLTPEHIEKLRQSHIGKKQSTETIERRKKSLKEYWENADRNARSQQTKAGFTAEVRARLSIIQSELQSTDVRRALNREYAKRRWSKQKETT